MSSCFVFFIFQTCHVTSCNIFVKWYTYTIDICLSLKVQRTCTTTQRLLWVTWHAMPYCTCAKVGYSSCQCNLVDFIIEVTLISIDYIQRYLCVGAGSISDHSSLLVKAICRHRFSTQLMEWKWIISIETRGRTGL